MQSSSCPVKDSKSEVLAFQWQENTNGRKMLKLCSGSFLLAATCSDSHEVALQDQSPLGLSPAAALAAVLASDL